MWKYILKRMGLAFLTAFIVLSITFILMKLLPFSKPLGTNQEMYSYYMSQVQQGFVTFFYGENAKFGAALWYWKNPVDNKTYYFYQVPIMQQYFSWIKNIITSWDWGVSTYIKPNVSAFRIIAERLPVTMKINIISVIISVPLGILLGIVAALKKNKTTDHVISTLVIILISVPGFVLITFLMLIFCYVWKILPTQFPAQTADTTTRVLGYILPIFCASLGSICGYCRFTRAELCEVMASDYLLLARTKGLTKRQSIYRHALRNAMVPIVPSIVAEFIGILGGSMVLEILYGIPGIGKLYLTALESKDYNVLFVNMAVFITIGLLAEILVDISYGFIDPRIRMGAKK